MCFLNGHRGQEKVICLTPPLTNQFLVKEEIIPRYPPFPLQSPPELHSHSAFLVAIRFWKLPNKFHQYICLSCWIVSWGQSSVVLFFTIFQWNAFYFLTSHQTMTSRELQLHKIHSSGCVITGNPFKEDPPALLKCFFFLANACISWNFILKTLRCVVPLLFLLVAYK